MRVWSPRCRLGGAIAIASVVDKQLPTICTLANVSVVAVIVKALVVIVPAVRPIARVREGRRCGRRLRFVARIRILLVVTMCASTFRMVLVLLSPMLTFAMSLVALLVGGLKRTECGERAIQLFDGGGRVVCAGGHVARLQIELRLITYIWWWGQLGRERVRGEADRRSTSRIQLYLCKSQFGHDLASID